MRIRYLTGKHISRICETHFTRDLLGVSSFLFKNDNKNHWCGVSGITAWVVHLQHL